MCKYNNCCHFPTLSVELIFANFTHSSTKLVLFHPVRCLCKLQPESILNQTEPVWPFELSVWATFYRLKVMVLHSIFFCYKTYAFLASDLIISYNILEHVKRNLVTWTNTTLLNVGGSWWLTSPIKGQNQDVWHSQRRPDV